MNQQPGIKGVVLTQKGLLMDAEFLVLTTYAHEWARRTPHPDTPRFRLANPPKCFFPIYIVTRIAHTSREGHEAKRGVPVARL